MKIFDQINSEQLVQFFFIFIFEKIYYTSKTTHVGFAKKLSSTLSLISLF